MLLHLVRGDLPGTPLAFIGFVLSCTTGADPVFHRILSALFIFYWLRFTVLEGPSGVTDMK
jgi:hypothetical protein